MPMLNSEFTINLSEPIRPGVVCIGYFDGIHPSIVAATRSDKIFIHNPHNRSVYDPTSSIDPNKLDSNSVSNNTENVPFGLRSSTQHPSTTIINDLNFLNINQTITCIATGTLSSNTLKKSQDQSDDGHSSATANGRLPLRSIISKATTLNDVLVVGTTTSIHSYDILHNVDLYYKEIPDGANTVVIGEFGQISNGENLALIGGNCAIHGFDRDGSDSYWMVTGDNITSMALVDFDDDNQNELIVGSQDCEIQIFKKDAIIAEMTETDKVTHLCSLGKGIFAYSLANGTVGVYQNRERIWRIKSKNQAQVLYGADINNNGEMELLTGWSNGKLDIRIAMTGEVLYRENYKCSVAGIMISDYNMDGKKELIVCTVVGDVYGYQLENQEERNQMVNLTIEQDTIRDLMKRKQTLLQELRNYEENSRIQNLADPMIMNKGKVLTERGDHFGAIPANTKLKSSLVLQSYDNILPDHIELRLETTNVTRIRAAIIFAEGIFKHESIVVYPHERYVSNLISVPLRPPKDVPVDMHVKALVGYRSSSHYHVFELSRRLPRFSMYSFIKAIYLNDKNNKQNYSSNKSIINNFDDDQDFLGFYDDKDLMFADDDNEEEEESPMDKDYFSIHGEEDGSLSRNDGSLKINKKFNTKTDQRQKQQRKLQQIQVHQPESYVIISINEKIENVVQWITENFLLDLQPMDESNSEEERRFEFISLRDHGSLVIELRHGNSQMESTIGQKSYDQNERQQHRASSANSDDFFENDITSDSNLFGDENKGLINYQEEESDQNDDDTGYNDVSNKNSNYFSLKTMVYFYTESIELAGNCIQSLAEHFQITNQPCHRARFPGEIKKLKQLTDRVEEIQSVRQHLVVEVADNANMIRAAVVQAEDARLTEEYQQMKQIYNDLAMLNRDIMREYKIRCQNHQDLVDNLKQINTIIQRASNLRVGSYKTSFISACREAIKQKNFTQLFKIINED